MIYKEFKFKNIRITFNKFPVKRKRISDVYLNGFHYWDDDEKNYSLVLGVFRIIFSVKIKGYGDVCEG